MVLHSVPVNTVEDGKTNLSPVRLRSSPASEGPRVLTPGDALSLAILPGESPAVSGDLAARPEVGSTVSGHQAEEVFRLLLGVQGDQLHALRLAVLHSPPPVEVVPVVAPGEKVALALPLIVPLGPGLADSLGSPGLLDWSGGCCASHHRGCSCSPWPGYCSAELVHNKGLYLQRGWPG